MSTGVIPAAPYENGVISQVTGGPIRPGGMDLTSHMILLCNLPTGAKILDAGCGSGGTVEILKQNHHLQSFGLDRSKKLLHSGHQLHPAPPLTCGISQLLPFASGVMDAVMAECSLSAMAEPSATLKEFRRILKPEGLLAISDMYARNPAGINSLRSLPLHCGLRSVFTQDEIYQQLKDNHFEITIWEDHSNTVKHLVTQMIAEYGSMSEFWSRSEPDADPFDIQIAVLRAKVGYYTLIARLY